MLNLEMRYPGVSTSIRYSFLLTLCILLSSELIAKKSCNVESDSSIYNTEEDTTSQVRLIRDSLVHMNFLSLPQTSFNSRRFAMLSSHDNIGEEQKMNSVVQKYFDRYILQQNYQNIQQQVEAMLPNLQGNESLNIDQTAIDQIRNSEYKDVYYSMFRANMVNINSENELNDIVTNATREMIGMGMNNLANDLFPFITMLMEEQHTYNYDNFRTIATKPNSKGIIDAQNMLNTMGTLDVNNKAGVCRDTHDMGLRIVRNMYREYLAYKYPDKTYSVDDYVFLQAWVTPSSQHVTLVVIDPENPRDYHELDWGRVFEKKDQEGVEVGRAVGTSIRLWQFDANRQVSQAINLVRSQWGALLDQVLLDADEQWDMNGIFTPTYASGASYFLKIGDKNSLKFTAGMLNAGERYFSSSFRAGKVRKNLNKYLIFNGFGSIQALYIDDTERKVNTMSWINWERTTNLITSLRYISGVKTKPITFLENFKFNLYAKSQVEVNITLSNFKSDDWASNNGRKESGDGNIWTTWGSELSYQNLDNTLNVEIKYNNRTFLIPNDVRLLSPNPFVLIKNASITQSAQGLLLKGTIMKPKVKIQPELRYEFNQMGAKFGLASLQIAKNIKTQNQYFLQVSYFDQLQGLEYYWYPKGRFSFKVGFKSLSKKVNFSLFAESIEYYDYSFGFNFTKLLK